SRTQRRRARRTGARVRHETGPRPGRGVKRPTPGPRGSLLAPGRAGSRLLRSATSLLATLVVALPDRLALLHVALLHPGDLVLLPLGGSRQLGFLLLVELLDIGRLALLDEGRPALLERSNLRLVLLAQSLELRLQWIELGVELLAQRGDLVVQLLDL